MASESQSHRDAARFSFLLATPVILAAGVLEIPDLTGALGAGFTGQILAGSAASFVCTYLSGRFLERYFRTRTLNPFAIYSRYSVRRRRLLVSGFLPTS